MKDLRNRKPNSVTLLREKSVLIALLTYSTSILIEWFVVFTSENRFPALYNPLDWPSQYTRYVLFGWQRTIALLLLPVGAVISWLAWDFLGYAFVVKVFIPYHKGSILAKLSPSFFKERPAQNYFLAKSEESNRKNLKTIVEASAIPFSSLLSIAILISRSILNDFPTFIKQPPFSPQSLILLSSSVFTNFALFIVLPVSAFIVSSIWILEGSGLRYYDPVEETIVGVVDDYRAVVGSVLGVGAIASFVSVLYDIMVRNHLGLDYVFGYLSFTILLLYPPTLLVTAIYIHFSEARSIDRVLKKMRDGGFSLPQVSSIELKE